MAIAPSKYQLLEKRLGDLKTHLLSFLPKPPASKTSYSAEELDLTRSYVVLAHAEIEFFCEELALDTAQRALNKFVTNNKISLVLRKIVAYYVGRQRASWRDTITPSQGTVDTAFKSYKGDVDGNNGLKTQNLHKLFHPLGLMDLDAAWLGVMNSFGSKRGNLAHKGLKAQNQLDAQTELRRVERDLLPGLRKIAREIKKLK